MASAPVQALTESSITPSNILSGHISESELAVQFRKSPRTLKRWRERGVRPKRTLIGKSIFYSAESVREWLASQEEKTPNRRGRRSYAASA
jgi:hypothetical protein